MSDFANYLRVAIQGLSHNTPLSRATAYAKVRKVIRRQLEAGTASEKEVSKKLEDLENAILDMEAEQLMHPTLPGGKPVPLPEGLPGEPVIVVKDAAAEETAPAAVVVTPQEPEPVAPAAKAEMADVPASGGGTVSELAARSPEPSATAMPQFVQNPAVSVRGSASQALKLETVQPDELTEFQSALTAQLERPVETAKKASPEPVVQVTPAPVQTPAPAAEPAPASQAPAATPRPQEPAVAQPAPQPVRSEPAVAPQPEPVKAGFDVRQILNRAIEEEDMRDPATREIVYRRARTALIKHLKNLSPQPDFDTVHSHIEELNAVIRESETEQSELYASEEVMDVAVDANDFMVELEDIWSTDLQADLEDVTVIDMQPEPAQLREVTPPREEPVVAPRDIADEVEAAVQGLSDNESGDAAFMASLEADLPDGRSIDDEVEDAVQELIAADVSRQQPARKPEPKPQRQTQPKAMPAASVAPDFGAELDDDFFGEEFASIGEEDLPAESAESGRWDDEGAFDLSDELFDQDFDDRGPPEQLPPRPSRAVTARPPRRRRRGVGAMVTVILLILVAGGGALAFPDTTSNYVGKIRVLGGEVVDLVAGLGGSTPEPDVEGGGAATAAIDEAATRNPVPETTENDAGSAGVNPEPAGVANTNEAESAGEVETAAVQPSGGEQPGKLPALTAIPGEKAFLYATTGGQQPIVAGNVAWNEIESSPQPGAPAEPAIRGDVVIPTERFRATVTLRRNLDKTLPATHLLELLFVPDEAGGSSAVASVERVTFLQSTESRGDALVGTIVKIADNIFVVALADIPEARRLHETLFRNPDLIEIQFTYFSGRRSALRLVTGKTGGEVFADAIDVWENGVREAAAPQSEASVPAETPPAPQVPPPAAREQAPAPTPAPTVRPAEEPAQQAPASTARTETQDAPTVAPGRPVVPDTVPIPPDRP